MRWIQCQETICVGVCVCVYNYLLLNLMRNDMKGKKKLYTSRRTITVLTSLIVLLLTVHEFISMASIGVE